MNNEYEIKLHSLNFSNKLEVEVKIVDVVVQKLKANSINQKKIYCKTIIILFTLEFFLNRLFSKWVFLSLPIFISLRKIKYSLFFEKTGS